MGFKKTISDSKKLMIGIAIYIAVFIVSSFFSPWETNKLIVSEIDNETANIVTDHFPVNIMFFGIYELLILTRYANAMDSYSTFTRIMFMVSAGAVFTYVHLLIKLIKKDDFDSFILNVITNHT